MTCHNSIENGIFSLFQCELNFYYNSGFYYKTGCDCLPELYNILPTRFVIDYFKTSFYYKTGCNIALLT